MSAEQELAIIKHKNERIEELIAVNEQLVARVEQLRGLAQSAAGWLSEAGEGTHAARVLELVGDMEAATGADMASITAAYDEACEDRLRYIRIIQSQKEAITELGKERDENEGEILRLAAKVGNLEIELTEARRDGERLDWIEAKRPIITRGWSVTLSDPSFRVIDWTPTRPARPIREAIDAAIAQEGNNGRA